MTTKEHKIETWTEFKTETINRGMNPQWVDSNNSYYIYAKDGFIIFSYELIQLTPQSSEQLDFETNYKATWNKRQDYRNKSGKTTVHTTPRPEGTTTYFSGSGDSEGLGLGVRLLFNMPLAVGS
jgi:hypothetical protein